MSEGCSVRVVMLMGRSVMRGVGWGTFWEGLFLCVRLWLFIVSSLPVWQRWGPDLWAPVHAVHTSDGSAEVRGDARARGMPEV